MLAHGLRRTRASATAVLMVELRFPQTWQWHVAGMWQAYGRHVAGDGRQGGSDVHGPPPGNGTPVHGTKRWKFCN